MVTKQKAKFDIGKFPKGVGIGIIVSIIVTLLGAAIGAWLLASEKIGEGSCGYICVCTLLLSGILGSWIAASVVGEKRLLTCILAGTGYLLSLLAITALFFGGVYSGAGEGALLILGASISAALLGLKQNKKPNRRHRK